MASRDRHDDDTNALMAMLETPTLSPSSLRALTYVESSSPARKYAYCRHTDAAGSMIPMSQPSTSWLKPSVYALT